MHVPKLQRFIDTKGVQPWDEKNPWNNDIVIMVVYRLFQQLRLFVENSHLVG